MKIGLFYGSDTGRTKAVAEVINEVLSKELDIDMYDVVDFDPEEIKKYDYLILGLSTWHDGELQSDWDTNFSQFSEIDFTGKTVALYGLGDQIVYCEYFVDGVGIIGQQVLDAGGKLIGKWPSEDYLHTDSKAELEEGYFCGLALDEDTEEEKTPERIDGWCAQVLEEFKQEMLIQQ